MSSIAFVDLAAQQERLGDAVEKNIRAVLQHGRYIMGPEIGQLEAALASFTGARHVISCGSGTDALVLCLMARGVGPGDAVLVPSFTFAATPESVALLGATPIFLDCRSATFNIDPAGISAGAALARDRGLRPVGLIAVDLFGIPAAYGDILPEAVSEDLWVLADAAQSVGAEVRGAQVGTLAPTTATSFFPAKPLGCYGDGGAVMTDDGDVADLLRSLRVHGKGAHKYDNVRVGMNARLDTMQAAVLLAKLEIFADKLEERQAIADRYADRLAGVAAIPVIAEGTRSAWAQYTIRLEERDAVAGELREAGVPTAIYYAKGLHQQQAYADCPVVGGGLPVVDELAGTVLSLPMHPYLTPAQQDQVIEAVRAAAST